MRHVPDRRLVSIVLIWTIVQSASHTAPFSELAALGAEYGSLQKLCSEYFGTHLDQHSNM
jgi:hypothetical protein